MVIFHSYVCLPEGIEKNSWFSNEFPSGSRDFSRTVGCCWQPDSDGERERDIPNKMTTTTTTTTTATTTTNKSTTCL